MHADACCGGEDWCAVSCTAALLSNKWHPVIVHRLLTHGSLGFSDLERRMTGISSKVLAENLEHLQRAGIVNRAIARERPLRVSYSLTSRGAALRPVIQAMEAWGRHHIAPQPRALHSAPGTGGRMRL